MALEVRGVLSPLRARHGARAMCWGLCGGQTLAQIDL